MEQSVGSIISLTVSIIYAKVRLKELLGLANLMKIQTFCIYEWTEVVMIGKHKNFMFVAVIT